MAQTRRKRQTKHRGNAAGTIEAREVLATTREHRRLGYSAAYCPKNATVKDPDLIRAIRKAYAAENVCIAEVGAWKNMLDPDAEKRRQNLEYVVDRCALAEAVGARCCVEIAATLSTRSSPPVPASPLR